MHNVGVFLPSVEVYFSYFTIIPVSMRCLRPWEYREYRLDYTEYILSLRDNRIL